MYVLRRRSNNSLTQSPPFLRSIIPRGLQIDLRTEVNGTKWLRCPRIKSSQWRGLIADGSKSIPWNSKNSIFLPLCSCLEKRKQTAAMLSRCFISTHSESIGHPERDACFLLPPCLPAPHLAFFSSLALIAKSDCGKYRDCNYHSDGGKWNKMTVAGIYLSHWL